MTILLEQPFNSSKRLVVLVHVYVLDTSIYGALKAFRLYGEVLHELLLFVCFHWSLFDPRVYYVRRSEAFLIIVVVVDALAFATNSYHLLMDSQNILPPLLMPSFFGSLTSFTGWTGTCSDAGIFVDRAIYARRLLNLYGMKQTDAVLKPLPADTDLLLPA